MSAAEGEEQVKPQKQLICDFEMIDKRLTEGKASLDWLAGFIDESASIYDYASRSIRTAFSELNRVECATDSCRTAIQTIAGDLLSFSQELALGYQVLQQELLDSSQRYREGYSNRVNEFRACWKAIRKELSESKDKTNKEKDAYFRCASQLEKAQKALETTIESIENGNLAFSSMIEPKTHDVLSLKEQTEKQELTYKKAIERTNRLITKRIASYNAEVEKILQVEQGRVVTLQALLSKHLKQFERMAKSSYEKAIQANLTLAKINIQPILLMTSLYSCLSL